MPALVIVKVEGLAAGDTVLVTLDDRIAATALTFADTDGELRFTALIPPEWLRTGVHRVRYFRLDDSSSATELAPLELT